MKSVIQKTFTLSVTQEEFNEGVSCAQYMMNALKILESLELCVQQRILLEIDNSVTVDLEDNLSVG